MMGITNRAVACVLVLSISIYTYIFIIFSSSHEPRILLNSEYVGLDQDSETEIEFRSFKIDEINCKKIIEGDDMEIHKFLNRTHDSIPNNETLRKHTMNCEAFKRIYGYDAIINTEEEQQFPIAFNILLYKDVAQVEILLRAIYRPQNYYCLHVDGFSPDVVHKAAEALADCFDNVFIVSKTENISYESFQRLQADINCMSDHLAKSDWKYLLNLPSQQLPLRTNAEIVQILKALNNTNYMQCILGKRTLPNRYTNKFENVYRPNGHYEVVMTYKRHKDPPHGIVVVKGSAYGIFTRGFVNYVVKSQIAKDLLEWCRGVLSPDEYYWSTLNHNPHLQVPGSYKVKCQSKLLLSVYVSWFEKGTDVTKCPGKVVRFICVFGIAALHQLVDSSRKELFANKFELQFSYPAIQCLTEWLRNKTLSPQPIDEHFYKKLYSERTIPKIA
ncbi:beta-1,3-galactosyl-O-glycosyl-glycoprotein beta-1,6-N-acetylglucosaminyltransferase [Patella vulgata]|uniref:beta-1,3-galactosyl-O-glycosyl-glycoprotein beta-1,6-N-acetylglucosaminyltransferase n=1 Tax=Patella vulgata TaxID=6465 RepID=UPI00217FBA6E|nr:beta-1,3-galactosyl-O-glycosyl-glycoprotein beta-1,6-N-acetylglucosaminyltransferase [Patella vulgata]